MSIKDNVGAIPTIGKEELKMNKENYYMVRPELIPYKGVTVTKDLKLKFKNDKVEQTIENLELISKYTFKTTKYTSENILKMKLEEGEILLLEEENRGYFLPLDTPVGTVDVCIEDLKALKLALEG